MMTYLEFIVESDELVHSILPHMILPSYHILPLHGLTLA